AEEFLAVGTSVVFEGPALCVSVVAAGRAYHEFPGAPTVHTVEELRAVAPDLRFDKVSFSNEELGRIDRARDFFGAHFTLCDLGVGLSEMNVIGTDKGAGVRHALEALDRPVSRTFAFGDSENDLPMLEAVEVPVAMGNALPRVKGMASYVTDSVEHDGVVSAMRHFGLI
ncbi:MAG: HAD hydrolase family protein, partial [Collinsella sp.]|nr:HAD hydrolase family protein [Collinsella sp.]